MGLTTVLILAIGLAMDALAVSISNAMCYQNMNRKWALLTAGAFGLFQGIMPVIGWFAGIAFTKYIESIDHYVALVLLGFIGHQRIVEAIREIRHPEAWRRHQTTESQNAGGTGRRHQYRRAGGGNQLCRYPRRAEHFFKRQHHLRDHLHLFSHRHPHRQKVRRAFGAEGGNFRGIDPCAHRCKNLSRTYIGIKRRAQKPFFLVAKQNARFLFQHFICFRPVLIQQLLIGGVYKYRP